ncbi:Nitrogen metabolite regulation-like protein bik4 [Penicillium rolfsii]|nr:Nitrogen metabolite regulation-like protein bik4 [Penicillium rolfsii]
MPPVIVFGPTGSVGSFVARTAQQLGAKVFLAMRDTTKAIPGLSADAEKAGGFERVQADLTQPDTVTTAVQSSGAKRAFIYRANGMPDHMRSTITALKSAGIDFVVFLSSYTVTGDPRDVKPDDMISFIHAQVEINLDEIFGADHYVAIRPGGFATNLLRFKDGIISGELKMYGPMFKMDFVTPIDMGQLSGTVLVQGPKNNQQKVYVYGPQIRPQKEGVEILAKAMGRDVKFLPVTPNEAIEQFMASGVPKPVALYMVDKLGNSNTEDAERAHYATGVDNVQLYLGRPATTLEAWANGIKDMI